MMQVSELMTWEVVSVLPETTLMDAALVMKGIDAGLLPVVDGGRVVGVLTDRDITVRATAAGLDPRVTPVSHVMTMTVVACRHDDDIRSVARRMQDLQLRRLLVVDEAGAITGIVSLGDLVTQTHDDQLAGEVLERISKPSGWRHARILAHAG